MRKRSRLILLIAPFAALAASAGWYHRTTPPWESAYVQWGNPDDLRYAYEGELRVPAVAAAIGYSTVQRRADDEVRTRAAAGWRTIGLVTKRMEAQGASEATLRDYRRQAIPTAIANSRKLMDGWLPNLTKRQKTTLWPRLVRWTGIWILSDRRVAKRVGLSEAERQAVADAADRLRWYYNDEQNAWIRTDYIYCGAPASTIATLGEQFRHTVIRAAAEREAGASETDPDDFYKTHPTEFTPSRQIPSWIDALHFDLVVRRVAAFRREEESRLLAALSPEQRRRWESLKAGQDPV